jgi:hypothetical protein
LFNTHGEIESHGQRRCLRSVRLREAAQWSRTRAEKLVSTRTAPVDAAPRPLGAK